MLSKLLRITGADDNLVHTCQYVLNHYGAKNTSLQVGNLVHEHLEYPSLLIVMDTLSEYGVESAAIRKGSHDYSDFELPFICTIQRPDWSKAYFTVVVAVDDRDINYLDPVKNMEALNGDLKRRGPR